MTKWMVEIPWEIDILAACRREKELPQLLAWIATPAWCQGIQAKTRQKLADHCQIWQSGRAQWRLFGLLRQPAGISIPCIAARQERAIGNGGLQFNFGHCKAIVRFLKSYGTIIISTFHFC
jgi:hypothetical protein